MPRLTISLSQTMHNRLSSLSTQHDNSLSNTINKLLRIGMMHLSEDINKPSHHAEVHCQQLIIQMNALLKNISVEILKFKQDDFDKLKQSSIARYNEIIK